jgi:hypothetical protein
MARIRIDDLPPAETLTPEQEALIAGAGLRSFKPSFEVLEGREMMDAGIGGALTTLPPLAQPGHVRTLEVAPQIQIEMPAATLSALAPQARSAARVEAKEVGLLGPVQTLKGGFDQSGNLIPGSSDASAAAVFTTQAGQKFMFVAGDEDQSIRMYKFEALTKEYTFVKRWDFSANLSLTEIDKKTKTAREVDIEAVTMIGNKLYWIGSGSNRGSEFKDAPNRDRIFRTDITVVNGQPELNFIGYSRIEDALIAHVPSLGDAASPGVDPKTTAGYNIEGLTNLPDGSVGIAFRAWGADSANALIVPVTNLDAVLTTGEAARFADPIRLDLGGRGIRDIMGSTYKDDSGTVRWQFLIIAGPAGAATGIGNDDFRLYTWTGNKADAPVMHNANLLGLTPEAVVLPEGNTKWDANTVFGLISDNGATVFDNNILGKDQAPADKQSRIDFVKLGAANGSVSKDLLETRRQGFLQGTQEFAFTATGSRAYFEVLGAGRDNVTVEVRDASGNKVGASNSSTGKNVLSLSQLSEGSRYTVSVTPVGGAATGEYTLSWRV